MSYGFYRLKRYPSSLNGLAKMLAEDAAIQRHPSFIHLRERWYDSGVLERAVYMHRLALTSKKVVIARNLLIDEATVRNYVAVDKLSSYWKIRIDAGESYAGILKLAKSDPRPDPKSPAIEPAALPVNRPEAAVPNGIGTDSSLAQPTETVASRQRAPAGNLNSDCSEAAVPTEIPRSRGSESSTPITPPRRSRQLESHPREAPSGYQEWLKVERKRRRLDGRLKCYHPQSAAWTRTQEELATLPSLENCDKKILRWLAEQVY
jgi:hypothetical protein